MSSSEVLQNLEIEGRAGSFFIPTVSFNANTGVCSIEGESYLENTWEFYSNLVNWLKRYSEQEPKRPVTLNFKLLYFNTSSSKGILDVLKCLKAHKASGGELTINWFYPEDDDDNVAEAEDFMADTDLPMTLIPY
ncbi:MAG: DUF1987 domain-containing protein [Cytophagales bacterium]|nr:MAG: DUF1987 domain-containing protein [Cytophagales bacterium]TAF62091.1 MAG: DUF1987 domain-containing protein [Cytophagales bacterium]